VYNNEKYTRTLNHYVLSTYMSTLLYGEIQIRIVIKDTWSIRCKLL